MERKFGTILLLVLISVLTFGSGCPYLKFEADDAGTSDSDADTDTDTDSDTDSDTDGDTGEPEESIFSGIDLLIVMDNSGSMDQEQKIMATSIYSLINMLVDPVQPWSSGTPNQVRAAVVSSDLGLQYGSNHSVEGFPYGEQIGSCTEPGAERGDDGRFQTEIPGTVTIASDQIRCNEDGKQCPAGWSCSQGLCRSPSGTDENVNCPPLESGIRWAETSSSGSNDGLATQVACMANLGTSGCGVEQQLEAAVRALSREEDQTSFVSKENVLVVLYVSDEEDCSIGERGLFETSEWLSGTRVDENDSSTGLLNTACNFPATNEEFLFDTTRYNEGLIQLKNNNPEGVVFVAIVGVPLDDSIAGAPRCQGQGNDLAECLSHPSMQLGINWFITENGTPYKHFTPACERYEDSQIVTSARPGRRYVKAAQSFGENGYVYSICNQDWSPAMRDIAAMIGKKIKE